MNGRFHIGHAFTVSKVDIASGYERLKGKKALFPFAFHCTGMPIKVSADKLSHEMQEYGCPPDFSAARKPAAPRAEPVAQVDGGKLKKAHSKQLQKDTAKFQWEIMEDLGLTPEEIPAFSDPYHWVNYFPPLARSDLQAFGCKIDWRRSFITTDVNPYYDAFIRWQFRKLKKYGKIAFGKRPTIYSPTDKQACMDHERASGEGVGLTEYTLVKQELQKPFPAALKALEELEQTVYLVPATLRPETMYGQTNCWVLPTGEYGAYKVNEKEIYVCSRRAAVNLSFQENSLVEGVVEELVVFTGQDLIGSKVHAPLSVNKEIYVLPMLTVSLEKTTGVVTSVPSDSPDDFASLRDLKMKPAFQAKFGVTAEMVTAEPVPIINIPELGDLAAPTVVERLKIKSQNDKLKLAEAKDECYQKGFSFGTMLVGTHKGKPVSEAKELVKAELIEANQALRYWEPASKVVSRSGDTCVVALVDQWYLKYGEEDWAKLAQDCVKNMNTFGEDVFKQLEFTIGWMHEWACSRSFGLGTKIPWDPEYLIESLSDSTIYMAYYTIAHLLQGGTVDGSKMGPAQIPANLMTDEVFDFVYLNTAYPKDCGISEEMLLLMRREYTYWYPVNLRVTGKDLVPNHITMWIYNHTAIFPKEMWPTGIKANGFLQLNNKKMSKSTGNFITLNEAIERFSADGVRLACAYAGDSTEDANFTTESADGAILRMYTLLTEGKEVLEREGLRTGPATSFHDKVFESRISQFVRDADVGYQTMMYRNIVVAFYSFKEAKDKYVLALEASNVLINVDLIKLWFNAFARVMAPITSYAAEYVWRTLLKNEGTVFDAGYPTATESVESTIKGDEYIVSVVPMLRQKLGAHSMPPKKKNLKQKPPATGARIYFSTEQPTWVTSTVSILKELYAKGEEIFANKSEVAKALRGDAELKKNMKKVMPFAAKMVAVVLEKGESALNLEIGFDEKETLEENVDYLSVIALERLPITIVQVTKPEDIPANVGKKPQMMNMPEPGKPLCFFDTAPVEKKEE
eukprot:TRINITY_DN1607_c0_g1_i1.p1 TRINITY_DN1607_c0_g1~~TRINITY_DN1607_c0_g1_i1.p1  ORF type:complete len:1025 (-),score=354.49 TRINITY_DN1607_c0_g1_i1:151-3225(-)